MTLAKTVPVLFQFFAIVSPHSIDMNCCITLIMAVTVNCLLRGIQSKPLKNRSFSTGDWMAREKRNAQYQRSFQTEHSRHATVEVTFLSVFTQFISTIPAVTKIPAIRAKPASFFSSPLAEAVLAQVRLAEGRLVEARLAEAVLAEVELAWVGLSDEDLV
jgi:hypothetical protein